MKLASLSAMKSVKDKEATPSAFLVQQNLERGKGQYLHHVSEEVKEERLSRKHSGLETPEKIQNLRWRLYQKAKQLSL